MSDDTHTTIPEEWPLEERPVPPAPHLASARPGPGARRFGYLVTIVVELVLLYLANGAPDWNVPFITNDWPDVLWALNLSLGATLVANVLFLAFDPWWFRRAAQVVLNAFSILSTLVMYRVFPFEFGRPLYNQVARVALLVAVIALAIAIIVEFVSLVLGRER